MERHTPTRRDQRIEWAILLALYLLQILNAEMLRAGIDQGRYERGFDQQISQFLMFLTDQIHPLAMQVFGIWFGSMALGLLLGRQLPRWTFDVPGIWFAFRLMMEFFTINALIFRPTIVSPAVLLAQIVFYLPYFLLAWGWIFQRLDWVKGEPGSVLLLSEVSPGQQISRFDYFHSATNTLLNKSRQTITGASRFGRFVVLVYMGMVLSVYGVVLARILQLSRLVI
jgi:hypothetical protein